MAGPIGAGVPLWWDHPEVPHPPIAVPADDLPPSVDVVIVGGGYTGLWSAYYLLRQDPSLSVLVLEAEHVGFGASGRNGGWVSALWPVAADRLAAEHGEAAARDQLAALRETVDEVGAVCLAEGIDAHYAKGGALVLARGPAQAARARESVRTSDRWADGTRWLGADEARERLAAGDVLGATYTPHCARIHPRLLADGLARTVRALGAVVAEHAPVAAVGHRRVDLADGRTILARSVVVATEAWTARLPKRRRRIAPVYSLMVATAPLTDAQWAEVGLDEREVFSDHGHVVIYGQRTADGRLAFGGRGAPYHLGSAIAPAFDRDEDVFAQLRTTLRTLLPQLGDVEFTHAWGGPLGIARDWHPSVGFDATTGEGWAGGYVGDGVAATNLAGRTLADLVLGRASALTRLPWVGHRSPSWEPEPLRWLGVNAGLRLAGWADSEEARTGRPARLGPLLARLTAH